MNKEFYKNLKEEMKTAQSILRFCTKHQAEFLPIEKGFILICPRQLDAVHEDELKALLPPEQPIKFEVAPKSLTRELLTNLIQKAKPSAVESHLDVESRSISIRMDGVAEGEPVWNEISETLKKDGFFDSWQFIIEGKEVNVLPKISDEISKNKNNRTESINSEDQMNLKIDLANAQSLEDILKAMG